MARVEITGGHPPDPARTLAILMDESRKALNEVNAHMHREVLARMARHRKTGHMMRSVFARVDITGPTTLAAVIGAQSKVAIWHEFGTGLYGPLNHWIEPKHAQALRWPNMGSGAFTLGGRVRSGRQGQYNYARRVRGIRPLRYFRDSILVVTPRVDPIMRRHADRAAERLSRAW